MSHWLYKGQIFSEVPEGAFGFIYRITNTKNGKKYIGRKYFFSTRKTRVSGQKRRRVKTTESKWQTYMGSSKALTEEIAKVGKKNFMFEILAIGYTKGQVNYMEMHIQCKLNVLFNGDYLNDCIGSGQYRTISITDDFKKSIEDLNNVCV